MNPSAKCFKTKRLLKGLNITLQETFLIYYDMFNEMFCKTGFPAE